MENIRQAVERARAGHGGGVEQQEIGRSSPRRPPEWGPGSVADGRMGDIDLSGAHLESKRIVAQDGADPRSKPFDMLRTQVLQSMDTKGWKTLAITSPTAGCGKTLTAINLALSIARQPERSVLLVDLDLHKPQVAKCFGFKCSEGLLGVLEGRTTLQSAIIPVRVGNCRLTILPMEASTRGSSEWMASRAMSTVLQDIKRGYHAQTVILDMPPMLNTDDVIAILPQIDCVLLVAAVGTSTVAEIKECNKHLQSADVVRLVLNKVPEASTAYSY